jgi:hypothetical protein
MIAHRHAALGVALGLLLLPGLSLAQTAAPAATPPQAPPAAAPPATELEPGVRTSTAAAPTTPAAPGAAPTSGKPRAPTTAGRSRNVMDRVELEASQITGNRELPRVLYIVPWKRSDLGDLTGKPVNSLLDEVLAPVDRDVFKRETRYFDALERTAPPAATPATAPVEPGAAGTAPAGEAAVAPAPVPPESR